MKPILACLALIVCVTVGLSSAAGQKPVQTQRFRPKWSLGQQWTIETQSRQQQMASPQQARVVARWQFTVEAVDAVQAKPCWRIVIRPELAPEPRTTVWVDQATMAIRQITTQLPTPGGYKTMTESYPSATAAPVLGPLSVLPIALPQFPEAGIKDLETYRYETISGPGGAKAIGEVGFSTEVRQSIAAPSAERLKDMLGEEHVKSLDDRAMVEVELAAPDEKVRQLWAADAPWPLFTDNGTTQARLIAAGRATRQEGVPAVPPAPNRGDEPPQATPLDGGVKSLETRDGFERGVAGFKPWSGSWWPIREGRLLVPLGKYDRLTGHHAAVWERQHNPPGPNVPHWFGYCNGWAAAATQEREPVASRTFDVPARIGLDVGDQKGLLTACHTEDLANSWGDRFGDGHGSEDPQDLQPDRLWRLLKLHLGQQGVPLVLDVEAGEEVWNYPIYDYELRYRPTSDGGYLADLTLLMADDAVAPSYRGTKPRKQTYQFAFKMHRGNVLSGSGQWVGRSKEDHPDFAWYPYKAVASNPEVKYPKVQQLVSAGPTEPTSPATPPAAPPATPPAVPPIQPVQPTEPAAPPRPQAADAVVLSPIELVALIANKTSSFEFDATLDRFDGATYRSGETYFMRVKSQRPGYLYLIQVDSSCTPSLLYPTAGEDNRIPAGKLVEVRPQGAAGGFAVAGPAGIVRVKAVVTSRPLAFSGSLEAIEQAPSQQQVQDETAPPGEPSRQPQAATPEETRPRQQVQARPVRFRWHPTQWRQVKALLSHDAKQTGAEQLGCPKPQELLGPFAQDMTTFYIDASPTTNKQ